jgi:hypothetical protein
MVAQVGYSVAGRSRGRVAPCAICTMHVETMSVGFLVEPQNQCQRFCLESPNQKTRVFLVLVALSGWFLDQTRQVFGEMCVRPRVALLA